MILCMHEMHLYANMWSLYVLGRYEVVFPFVVCITQAGLAKFFSLQLGGERKKEGLGILLKWGLFDLLFKKGSELAFC